MKNDFLLELGCEDLPAGQINNLLNSLAGGFVTYLKNYGLSFSEDKIQTFATPRRLAVLIPDVAAATEAKTIERRGPSKAQGFDNGQPSKALLGFLQSTSASLKDIIEVPTDKGVWLAVKVHKPAQKVQDLLPLILTEVIKTLPLKKSMRWGDHPFHFVRPVQWLLMLYGKEVIDAEVFGVKADRLSYGHRFTSGKAIKITQPKEYAAKLLKAQVMADAKARKENIEEQAQALVGEAGQVRFNTLPEVINLVEWPQAILCDFKREFLKIPKEVLISAMETHQRVFPILDASGNLTAQFIAVSNSVGDDVSEIKLGNEKVIAARLADAEFFFMADAKVPLQNRLDDLKKIHFQEKLGTLFDKVMRVRSLAVYLAEQLNIPVAQVKQAAELCKGDLTTDMVQEFPELQGIMGREYALKQGVTQEIAEAIEDHYKPKVRDGELPRNQIGAVLALADKLDTLVGLFGVGEKPSGSGDPYALRRQALGVIAIIIKFSWSLDLINVVRYSYATFLTSGMKLISIDQELADFFLERMAQWCLDEHSEISTNVVNAVKSRMLKDIHNKNRHDLDLLEFFNNARDLNQILAGSDGQELLQLVKRAANIIPDPFFPVADYPDLKEPAEQQLIVIYEKLAKEIHECKKQKQFLKAYTLLLSFKAPLAQFFNAVKVMVDDKTLQQERLSLLYKIMFLFYLLADFSCL